MADQDIKTSIPQKEELQGSKGDKGVRTQTNTEKKPSAGTAGNPTLSPLEERKPSTKPGDLEFILDVPLRISVQLGTAKMLIRDLLQLGQGSVIELEKLAGEPMDIYIGDKLIARGEVVVVNEKFGVRMTDIVSRVERIKQLNES